ncbi:MAG: TonB-dependent receptor [Bacteroidetes bacterium]|nr:MAG: TonB-dependent receptor [Bacteroidota bacterium]
MILSRNFILFLLFISPAILQAQEIHLNYSNTSLNKILIDIRDSNDLHLSFDDKLLSKYKVTVDKTFPSPETAILQLIRPHGLTVEKDKDVFVIYKNRKQKRKKQFLLAGQIKDATNGEPLPYSYIIINDKTIPTDVKGSFSYLSETDSIFTVKASHLGYYILDTTMNAVSGLDVLLYPSSIGLSEVVIKNKKIERSTQIGDKPGLMKLNHKVAHFLPGYGDNSVFNLLRLMPGIVASGEQTNDLLIWGSYAGQSQVLFDGFTIYGLKNFNDNISAFNPLLAKDIEILKGGYDARFGEKVGGIVNITGKTGNPEKFGFTINVNNMTLNTLFEIPLFKKASLQIAFRHTYYNLYNPDDMNFLIRQNNDADTTNDIDVNIVPDYVFRDLNIKYSQQFGENDLFYIILYGANDKFQYTIDDSLGPYRRLYKSATELNTQSGGTAFYGKTWRNGNTSNFDISYSKLDAQYTDDLQIRFPVIDSVDRRVDKRSQNVLTEFKIKADNRFSLSRSHTLEWGAGIISNTVTLVEDTFAVSLVNISENASRYFIYAQDYMALGNKTVLKAGLRYTHAFNLQKVYFEPRISLSVQATQAIKINAAWGIYNQYFTQSSVVDELGNYRYIWTICNNEDIPVLQAQHYVLSGSFQKEHFVFSLEGYYKFTEGITRYINFPKYHIEAIATGKSRSYGMDVFLQGNFKNHSAWISYSLSKTEEFFNYFIERDYRRSPYDQRHEVKVALLLNFDPFYFSTNYVFGSGFPFKPGVVQSDPSEDFTYSRLDASFIYKFLDRKLKGEAGISVLNVLNRQNIKYTNFERIPTSNNSISIYAEAIPFTPTLYLKFAL